jgi:hypothetical protein
MISKEEIQILKRIFNRSTATPPKCLYIRLEKFMKTEKLYSKQRLKEWIEHKFIQQDKELYGDSDAIEKKQYEHECQIHRKNCESLLAERRKLQKEESNKESLGKELDLDLQIRKLEKNIAKLQKKIDNNEIWLDRRLLKSPDKDNDRLAMRQLTDFKIIERWGAGGRNRTWLDQYCADGIDLWDEHFGFDSDEQKKKKLDMKEAIELKVPLHQQLTYCLICIIYELMAFIRTSECIILFLNGEDASALKVLFPLKSPKEKADSSEDENNQVNDVIPSDAMVERLSTQIGNANYTLCSLEEKIPLLLQCLTKIKTDKFVDLNQTNRDVFTATQDGILAFLSWSQESRALLAKIISRLTKLFSTEFLDPSHPTAPRTFPNRTRAANPSSLRNSTSSLTSSGPYAGQTFRSHRFSDDADSPRSDSTVRRHSLSGSSSGSPQSLTPPLSGARQ